MRRKKSDISEDRVPIANREQARTRTMNRAVKLLAAKPRSVMELRERLLEKAWTDERLVDDVLGRLKQYGYLDDDQYARDLAMSKLRQKPQGKRRLEHAMRQKKLDEQTRETAVALAFDQMPESELIELAIAKRIRQRGTPETREDKKKLFDHLLRQGFDCELIREKMSLKETWS